LASGGAALFLAATGHFLPHDEPFLGMRAIGVHFAIGYTDALHLATAVTGALLYAVILLSRNRFRFFAE
jgi:hypothetical protein